MSSGAEQVPVAKSSVLYAAAREIGRYHDCNSPGDFCMGCDAFSDGLLHIESISSRHSDEVFPRESRVLRAQDSK